MLVETDARATPRLVMLVTCIALYGCAVPSLDLDSKQCPCSPGWTCDAVADICVRGDSVPEAEGQPAADGGSVTGPELERAVLDEAGTVAQDAHVVPVPSQDAGNPTPPLDASTDAAPEDAGMDSKPDNPTNTGCATAALDAQPQSVSVTIARSEDDAEEDAAGTPGEVILDSSDLEMTDDTDTGRPQQVVGLRFASLSVPPGAAIDSAYVEFHADRDELGPTSLSLTVEDADDASDFAIEPFNLSARTRVTPAVPWDAVEPWTENERYATPELAVALQGVVCRAGWTTGNAVVVLVEGTGVREATAHDQDPAQAATLHVRYRQ